MDMYSVWEFPRFLVLLCGLVMIARADLKERIIPNQMIMVLLAIRSILLLQECVLSSDTWGHIVLPAVWGTLSGGGFFLICREISRGGVGAGDVKLFATIGYYLGGRVWNSILCSLFLASVWSLCLFLRGKGRWKKKIPLAPFVLAGTALAMLLETGGQDEIFYFLLYR